MNNKMTQNEKKENSRALYRITEKLTNVCVISLLKDKILSHSGDPTGGSTSHYRLALCTLHTSSYPHLYGKFTPILIAVHYDQVWRWWSWCSWGELRVSCL